MQGIHQWAVAIAMTAAISVPAFGQETPTTPPAEAEASRLGEDLIYSVDRTPERTFDTSRAVEVINHDAIRRANPRGLADLLAEQAGIVVSSTHSGGSPIVRGLSGKQLMLLIDGVKVNNAGWGNVTREYLNIIDLNQVERIEIVRGVVSVLGTESLGGVINIITRKGSTPGDAFGGSISARYSSADSGFSTPIEVFGQTEKVRFNAGISYGQFGDLRGGEGRDRQNFSSFEQRSGYLNGQWLLTPEKTIGFGYQNVEHTDVEGPGSPGLFVSVDFTPRTLQLANLSYLDLTARSWEDSLRVTGYWNRQSQMQSVTIAADRLPAEFWDGDKMMGLNLELGKFLGSHHLIYGLDLSSEVVDSGQETTVGTDRVQRRGNNMDGAEYEALGIYLQDRFNPATWVTVIAGARYGQFRTSGSEQLDIGPMDIENQQGDVTGALNLIFHVTPQLNLIANGFRGFRAPNIDDMSRYNFVQIPGGIAFQVPTPAAEPERVTSFEGGVKYDNGNFGGSAFYYRNKLTNLLTLAPGTFNGLPFRDTNGNGIKEPNEFVIVQNQNVGTATIHGFELDGHYKFREGLMGWAHYSSGRGTDTRTDLPLSAIPPAFGTAGLRYSPAFSHRPWVEFVYRYYGEQDRLGRSDLTNPDVSNGKLPGFNVFHLRGGMDVTERFSVNAALENLTDENYRTVGSTFFEPGRQLVLGTRFNF